MSYEINILNRKNIERKKYFFRKISKKIHSYLSKNNNTNSINKTLLKNKKKTSGLQGPKEA
jgi:hypothetical protein